MFDSLNLKADFEQANPSNEALSQELERIRSYVFTIQRSISETTVVSQNLKQDLETVREHRQNQDEEFNYDEALNQCLQKSEEIQLDTYFPINE